MQIVVNIPKKTYDELRTVTVTHVGEAFAQKLIKYIKNGTPLPKGHGRIGDLDRLYQVFERNVVGGVFRQLFDMAPTIIEAESEEE